MNGCPKLEDDLQFWRTTSIALAVILVGISLVCAARLIRARLLEYYFKRTEGPSTPSWSPGNLSDATSESSSLFSPPIRTKDNIVFQSAAANISATKAMFATSVSTEQLDRLLDGYSSQDDSASLLGSQEVTTAR